MNNPNYIRPMTLEKQYSWLTKENGPRMLKVALDQYGTVETPGKANNKVILDWAGEIGGKVDDLYRADEIPWCGLFMAIVAKRGGKAGVKDPLWALNWGAFGVYTPIPMLGDVLVFVRKTTDGKRAGHVGLYVGEDDECYHVLGGNQSDKVCITRIHKDRLYTSRRPAYHVQPSNVRVIKLQADGKISENEQ